MRVVSFNLATLDGRIAVSPRVPSWLDSRWTPAGAIRTEHVDLGALANTPLLLEGSNSFVSREAGAADWDHYGGRDLHVDTAFDPATAKHWMVVPDSRGRVRWRGAKEGDTAVLVLVTATTPAGYLKFLRETEIPYLVVGDTRVDLAAALSRVGAIFDTDEILSTAGGVLNGVLLRHGMLSELAVQFLPVVLGRPDAPSIFEGYQLGVDGVPALLDFIDCRALSDGSVLVRYRPRHG